MPSLVCGDYGADVTCENVEVFLEVKVTKNLFDHAADVVLTLEELIQLPAQLRCFSRASSSIGNSKLRKEGFDQRQRRKKRKQLKRMTRDRRKGEVRKI